MNALENISVAIERALDECVVEDVLALLTGVFVGMTVEVVRRSGNDANKEITVSGGKERDITIHAPK